MLLKSLAVAAALLASLPCAAQDYEKNGMPCLAEVCIGDSVADLAKTKWDAAKVGGWISNATQTVAGRKISDTDVSRLKPNFPQPVGAAAPYLHFKAFDNTALAALANVKAVCAEHVLTGTFTTANGNPTIVMIALMADADDPAKQTWRVHQIIRKFPGAVTKEQMAEVRSQLNERYANYLVSNHKLGNPKPGDARVNVTGYSDVQFGMYMQRGPEYHNRLKMHPACGGTAKVKID
jgi:hypothetical protein